MIPQERELYVYYRVPCERSRELQTAVGAMQARLERGFSVKAALKRRPESTDGRYTWMEIYTGSTGDFETALEKAAAEAGLDALIDGQRHTEVFVDASTCA